MNGLRHQNYKNENAETKYLNNIQKGKILKVKSNLWELGKDFKELRHRELKDRKINFRREIEELFLNELLCLYVIWISFDKKKWCKRHQLPKTLGRIG